MTIPIVGGSLGLIFKRYKQYHANTDKVRIIPNGVTVGTVDTGP
jgi:hypothetical protein